MHGQLEYLLEIQDLKAQRDSLLSGSMRELQERVFDLQPDEALKLLDTKIEELKGRLDPDVATRYDRLCHSVDRTVVPVLAGICYGCFVAVPRSWASDPHRNRQTRSCAHCGRFLYYVD